MLERIRGLSTNTELNRSHRGAIGRRLSPAPAEASDRPAFDRTGVYVMGLQTA